MRKVISPQRDLFASIVVGVESFPGMTDDDQRYFRDVYDHLIRIGDMVDTYRDLLTGAMDVYLSTVSNRLNAVMKQLAIIATVFMPLTFLTGFFGQNLGWMVDARRRARPLPRLRDRARADDARDRARLLPPQRAGSAGEAFPAVALRVARHRDARPQFRRRARAREPSRTSGMCPAQTSSSASGESPSSGGPSRTLADASSSGSDSTPVAFSSLRVGVRRPPSGPEAASR